MLKEFEDAVRGMKAGESKTFPLAFPADYHGKDVAGKTADFLVTVKKIEAAKMPYDAGKDFAGITQMVRVPNVLVMNAARAEQLKIHSVADLIAYAKANPGKLNYG